MPEWRAMSQAERDASYDNNKAVANSAALIEQRNAASATFRQDHSGHLDLAYGPRERNKWDLYPAARADAPCLVFIHGGYWQRNQREDFAGFAAGVMAHGWSAAMPGYTLAPEATLSDIVAEIDGALTWLAANGPAHGLAAGPIVVSGWSAGGHLASLALAHAAISAGCAISGVYELGPIAETYLDEKLQLGDEEIATLSTLRLPPVDKPLLIAYGSRELWPLVGDSRALHEKRAAAHCPGALLPVAGGDHFTIVADLGDPTSTLVRHILALAPGSRDQA